MREALLALSMLAIAAPLAAQDEQQPPALPGWMAGCWEMRDPDGGPRWAEECWTVPRGGQMLGSSRMGAGGRLGSWEFMRIERDAPDGDGPAIPLAFSASPGGRGWTLFAWSPSDEEGLSFVNQANDYPQLIRYWREGEVLKARISLIDGSRPFEFTYRPMGGGD